MRGIINHGNTKPGKREKDLNHGNTEVQKHGRGHRHAELVSASPEILNLLNWIQDQDDD